MKLDPISRRYFISNGFDGALTLTGIAVGSYLSGVTSNPTVFKVAVGAAVGLATSGVWSVWEIERAEKLSEIDELEAKMMTDLEGTELEDRKMENRKMNSFMSGLGPVLGVVLPASFYLVPGLNTLQATIGAVFTAISMLFLFGVYMSRISDQIWWKAGLRMGLAGIAAAVINVVLPG
ncbi:VIT1/CCC1 transporter family protein [Candidatus Nanohalococcus occultus]|uniref:VIT1/CCC1 transporter family protein n=1 Tax=Candidatus Nanohalococcus occultus TaxID=2978047 RepID=UPI0039DFE8DD